MDKTQEPASRAHEVIVYISKPPKSSMAASVALISLRLVVSFACLYFSLAQHVSKAVSLPRVPLPWVLSP